MSRTRRCIGSHSTESTVNCGVMATIQVVIDDALLERLDYELQGAVRRRSAFVRGALDRELRHRETMRLEEEHRRSYAEMPETEEEREEARAWSRLAAESLKEFPWDEPDR